MAIQAQLAPAIVVGRPMCEPLARLHLYMRSTTILHLRARSYTTLVTHHRREKAQSKRQQRRQQSHLLPIRLSPSAQSVGWQPARRLAHSINRSLRISLYSQTGGRAGRQATRQAGEQADRLVGWQADGPTGGQVDRIDDCKRRSNSTFAPASRSTPLGLLGPAGCSYIHPLVGAPSLSRPTEWRASQLVSRAARRTNRQESLTVPVMAR